MTSPPWQINYVFLIHVNISQSNPPPAESTRGKATGGAGRTELSRES